MFDDHRFLSALGMLIGTIIGAGIFGLPYVAAKTGLVPTVIYLAALTVVVVLMHLLYGEVVLRTQGKHRLVGYAEIYLGKWGKRMATLSVILGSYAALLIYIILGGVFLSNLFEGVLGGDAAVWSVIMFFISFIFVSKGLKMVSALEMVLSFLMVGIILVFLTRGSFLINPANFSGAVNWSDIFLPYGVILFSLTGGSVIPELAGVLDDDESRLKKTIIWGTLIPAIVYLLFIVVVFGITGADTTPDAISGLQKFYGNGFVKIGALVGFLAVITSLLAFGINLRKVFNYDYHFPKSLSLVLALFVPFLFFLAGVNDFIRVIGFSGAVMGGIDGILIILMYRKADRERKGKRKPEYDIITSSTLEYLLAAIFIAGIVYTILHP